MKKRLLSALLCCVMLLTLLTSTAFAEVDGSGSYETKDITFRTTEMLTNTVTVTYDGKDDRVNTDTFDLMVEKKWSSSGTKPSSVMVQLYRNNTPVEQGGEITILTQPDSDTGYGVFEDLPLYDENGRKIIYSVKETAIDGATLIEEGATVDFGDGDVICDVFETNDKIGKWYAAYEDTIATDNRIRITNRYFKNAIVVTKEITKIVRSGEELTDKTAAKAGDTIYYTVRIENTTKSQQTIKFLDQLNTNSSNLKFTGDYNFKIDDLGAGSYKAENITIGAGEIITLNAEYAVQVGDGRLVGNDYYVTNTIIVNCNGALYEDEVSTKIEKDPDAYKIYVPIIKTLNNDGKDDFDGERFGFKLCVEGQDDTKYNWNAYISVGKVHAGGFADEDNMESGEPNTVIELAEEDFENLPIDEETSCPYILISEIKGSNNRVTYDAKTYKLYLVPEKDSGSALALLADIYDPAETHILYAIADLDAWNKEDSGGYDCAVKFVNYYDKREVITRYTVTFDANGGTLNGETTAKTGSDGKLASLPTPTRDGGYVFEGWYTEKTGGTKVTTETVFKADTIVYAHWTYTKTEDLVDPIDGKTSKDDASNSIAPKTGDNSAVGLWSFILCVSLAICIVTTTAQRRSKREEEAQQINEK